MRYISYSPDEESSFCDIWIGGDCISKSADSPSSGKSPSVGNSSELSSASAWSSEFPSKSSSISSESWLEGRSNTSSSESCACSIVVLRSFRRLKDPFSPWRSGQVGNQISGSSPSFCLFLQWLRRRKIGFILMWDGSFHLNFFGTHPWLIQEDGRFIIDPHGTVCVFFPVTYPIIYRASCVILLFKWFGLVTHEYVWCNIPWALTVMPWHHSYHLQWQMGSRDVHLAVM